MAAASVGNTRLPRYRRKRIQSEEAKRKIGLAQKGKILSEETRRKISLANKGHKLSAEARLNMSLNWHDSP